MQPDVSQDHHGAGGTKLASREGKRSVFLQPLKIEGLDESNFLDQEGARFYSSRPL